MGHSPSRTFQQFPHVAILPLPPRHNPHVVWETCFVLILASLTWTPRSLLHLLFFKPTLSHVPFWNFPSLLNTWGVLFFLPYVPLFLTYLPFKLWKLSMLSPTLKRERFFLNDTWVSSCLRLFPLLCVLFLSLSLHTFYFPNLKAFELIGWIWSLSCLPLDP